VDKGLIRKRDHHAADGFLIGEPVSVVNIVRSDPFIYYELSDARILDVAGLLSAGKGPAVLKEGLLKARQVI
jgi:hypothetical protein